MHKYLVIFTKHTGTYACTHMYVKLHTVPMQVICKFVKDSCIHILCMHTDTQADTHTETHTRTHAHIHTHTHANNQFQLAKAYNYVYFNFPEKH